VGKKRKAFRHQCLNSPHPRANRGFLSAIGFARFGPNQGSHAGLRHTERSIRSGCHGEGRGFESHHPLREAPGKWGLFVAKTATCVPVRSRWLGFLAAPSLFFGDAADSAQDPLGAGREIQRDDLEQPVASAAARCDALRANVSAARLKWAFDVAAHRLSGDSACSKGSAPRVRGPAAHDVDVRPARPRPRPRARRP
jgi:hypothetical protein